MKVPARDARAESFCTRLAVAIAVFAGAIAPPPTTAQTITPSSEEALSRGLVYTMQDDPWIYGYFGFGCGFADLDGDGDPDVIAVGAEDARVGIFENDGTGHFTDRSAGNGIPTLPQGSGFTAFD